MDGPSENMLSWFEDDELAVCPSCGEKKVVPARVGDGMVFCTSCGIVAGPPQAGAPVFAGPS
jgi:ribosomal protein L37AE/L43A